MHIKKKKSISHLVYDLNKQVNCTVPTYGATLDICDFFGSIKYSVLREGIYSNFIHKKDGKFFALLKNYLKSGYKYKVNTNTQKVT